MADFSFLTDSDDERAVEDLLSQAIDQSVLEQVSAINCSSFAESPLPSHLESRFRKLKSFPSTNCNSNSDFKPQDKSYNQTESLKQLSNLNGNPTPAKLPDSSVDDDSIFKPSKQDHPLDEMGSMPKPENRSFRSPSNSSKLSEDSSIDYAIFAPSKREPFVKTRSNSKSGRGSKSFRSNSWTSSAADSDSPPRKNGCFWCSPKKSSRKQSTENRGIGLDWGKEDDLLSDLGSFSIKEQKRILKKAMKEEEKINREAEKIVKWAKQVSLKMEVAGLDDDELSDNDITK